MKTFRIVFCCLIILLALVWAGRRRPVEDTYPVTFTFMPGGAAQTVSVAGTFNDWNPRATLLEPDAARRVWSCTLRLEPGEYQYKFVVDGSRWFVDPKAARNVEDGSGNLNSVLLVAPRGYDRPARVGDGSMTETAVYHAATPRWVNRPDARSVLLTVRTRRGDVARVIALRPGATPLPMQAVSEDALFTYWRVQMPLPSAGPLRYAFRLDDGAQRRLYDRRGRDGRVSSLRDGGAEPDWLTLDPQRFPVFETPDWARDAVFYQIFPDRFANGDPTNDPKGVVSWDAQPTYFNRFGGDLAGIRRRLDYLQSLGVNALYLNPVFAARSNHRYDTTDYRTVDPGLGTHEDLRALVRDCHRRGWRVILDGVFNHTGVDFAAFKDVQMRGADSPYRDWYFIKAFPVVVQDNPNYEGWWGSPWMPKLNVMHPPTRDYLLDVGTRWIREADIDGWRLDVANEVDSRFWRLFRQRVRAVKPDAYLVGEIWGDGRPWLQGDQFDSVMNYRWRGAVLDYFAFRKIGPAEFDRRLARIRGDYPPQVQAVLLNMLGSHDTERLLTLCRGDVEREKMAVLFQMTYPGAPCVYYGDEVGMEGGGDPDNRRGMVWSRSGRNADLLAFYRRVIRLRRRHAVLRRGDYKTLVADDRRGLFAYARRLGAREARVYFNTGTQAQVAQIPPKMEPYVATRPLHLPPGSRAFSLPSGAGVLLLR